jgi:hypothetical protein
VTGWLILPRNWDHFQHADATKRGRNPRWIKNYTALTSDDDYLDLTGHQRAILHGLWLEYARSGRHLHLNTRSLSARLRLRVMRRDLEALNHAGFIEFCQDNVQTTSRPEVEKRKNSITRAVVVDADERHSFATFLEETT